MAYDSGITRHTDDRSGHLHRKFIGILGFLFPFLLLIVAKLRPTPGLPLESVSAYYHSGAVVVFVGTLCALAVCFFTYKGYDNPAGRWDRRAAFVAGVAAAGVAFSPTGVDGFNPQWWTDSMGVVHYVSAIILFASFIVFSWFLFPKSNQPTRAFPVHKRRRNLIYRVSALGIVLNVGWIVLARLQDSRAPIFLPEVFALEFFAASWLVKGQAERSAVAVAKQAAHYVAHPTSFGSDAWALIAGPKVHG